MPHSSELTVRSTPSIAEVQRSQFNADQVALIQATVAKEASPAELALFLETCVRHQLDPFIKEVWAIKLNGAIQTVVSRDGLLKIANRSTGLGWAGVPGEFQGCQSGVVHEHDYFDHDMEEREDGTVKVKVSHKPRAADGKPTFGGVDGKGRGDMVGSFAVVRRRGHSDVFFVAYRAEYDKKAAVWKSHPHAMMAKVAEAMALRKAFSIAGVVGEGEVERQPTNITETAPGAGGGGELNMPENEVLAEELTKRFRALGYRRSKVRILLANCQSEDEYKALIQKLDNELDEEAGAPPEDPGEVITDATVVG